MVTRWRILLAVFGIGVLVGGGILLLFRSGILRLTLDDLRAQYATGNSQYMDFGNLSIHVEDEGSGPAVLLLHGSFGSLRGWDAMVDELRDRFRFIRFDLPGYGLSGRAPPGDSMEDISLLGIVHDILDRLDVEQVSVVGTSVGGNVAFWLASGYPERVERLVLINTPSGPVAIPRSARPPAVRWQMRLCDDLLKFRTAAFWRTYYSYLWGDSDRLEQELLDEYYDLNRRQVGYLPPHLVPRNPEPPRVAQMLKAITAPTLLIWGMRDPVLPPSALDQMAQKLETAPKIIIKLATVGHYPMLEAPDEVTRLVGEFLSGN